MKTLKSEPIKTVLTITVGFLIIYILTDIRLFLLVSLVIGVVGISSTRLAKMIDFLWMKLTYILSLIVPNILLTVIFYVFLFPISSFSKLFGKKDPLNLKNTKPSVFKNMDKEFKPDSFENPW